MRLKTGYGLVLFTALLIQGCGTIVHGTMQDLTIATTPPGATATINGRTCETPCTLNVPRTATQVTVEKGTYRRQFELDRNFNLWSSFFGNFIFYLLPGVVFDDQMGGAYELLPVNIELVESGPTGTAPVEQEPVCAPCPEVTANREPADEKTRALSFGVAYNRMYRASEMLKVITYETSFFSVISGYAAIGYRDHQSDYGEYKETAAGKGWEIGMWIYPGLNAPEGWYLGGGLGFWSFRGNWNDDVGTPFVTEGQGASHAAEFDFRTGYKFYPMQRPLFIDPYLSFGLLIPGSGTPDVFGPGGGYTRAGLAIGLTW